MPVEYEKVLLVRLAKLAHKYGWSMPFSELELFSEQELQLWIECIREAGR